MAAKKNQKEHRGKHHILPTSRGGQKNRSNEYPKERWNRMKHVALHMLFVNMTPGEIISTINRYIKDDGSLDNEFFHNFFSVREKVLSDGTVHVTIIIRKARANRATNKIRAWRTLFGDLSPTEAIEWIEKEFIRKEWLNEQTEDTA